MEAAKIGPDLRLREPRAKILSRLMQICVFTPSSKGFLRLSVLSIYSPYSKQIDFFDFGMKDNLENDLVGVEPAASILRLTVVCLLRVKTTARVWYLTSPPTQRMSVIFSRVNFFFLTMIQIHLGETSRPRDFIARSVAVRPRWSSLRSFFSLASSRSLPSLRT